MAELGIAASGIGIASLGIQVADSVLKLKDFLDGIKEAPEEIKYTLEEIETISLVLSEIVQSKDNDNLAQITPLSATRCLELCQKGTTILGSAVADLDLAIRTRRKIGSIKAVLKKGTMNRLRDRLKNAQVMLMLSNQVYSETLQKERHEIQRRWAESHQNTLQLLNGNICQSRNAVMSIQPDRVETPKSVTLHAPPERPGICAASELTRMEMDILSGALNEDYHRRNSTYHRPYLILSFQAPKWTSFTRRVLDIKGLKLPAGWNFYFQTYNIIPADSPAWELVQDGDVDGIQSLFRAHQASPFDRDQYGLTLLDFAAFNQRIEVCRLLVNEGADPNISRQRSSLLMACQSGLERGCLIDVVRLLSQTTNLEDPLDFGGEETDFIDCQKRDFFNFRGSAQAFSWLLRESQSTCRLRSLEDCVRFAIKICGLAHQPEMASLMRIILEGRLINPTLCNIQDNHDRKTLLHCAAWHLGEIWGETHEININGESVDVVYVPPLEESKDKTRTSNLLGMIGDLISGGSAVHGLAQIKRGSQLATPLLEVFSGCLCGLETSHWSLPCAQIASKITSPTIRRLKASPAVLWLQRLQTAGIDLIEYGRKEKQSHLSQGVKREYSYYYSTRRSLRSGFLVPYREHLISFTYGPEPEDWDFWFAPTMDDSFVEFWGMVDHPERAIPGAWEDECDEDEV